MEEVSLDVVEDILVGLDVKDLIRCKSVCKSWQSLISTPRFVKAHLNHAYKSDRDNNELRHRRIYHSLTKDRGGWLHRGDIHSVCSCIVGSCNGLLCVYSEPDKFLVTNPSTRELKKLPSLPSRRMLEIIATRPRQVIMGFGYDAAADDYKVIAGFRKNLDTKWTTFYVLTLKSNTWKVMGKINYVILWGKYGILFDGALHWLMTDDDTSCVNMKIVIISLNLSTQEFKEIPLPDDLGIFTDHRLTNLEDSLCIYSTCYPLSTWVMKNNKWELYVHDHCRTKYDVTHCLSLNLDTQKMTSFEDIDSTRVHSSLEYICANIFVKSLVSPHLHNNNNNEQVQRGNIRKRKRKRKRNRKPKC